MKKKQYVLRVNINSNFQTKFIMIENFEDFFYVLNSKLKRIRKNILRRF